MVNLGDMSIFEFALIKKAQELYDYTMGEVGLNPWSMMMNPEPIQTKTELYLYIIGEARHDIF